jgi:DNA-binding transcriptional MerR regulator
MSLSGKPSGGERGERGSARGSLPPKLYFRIGEVASLVGVEPHVLRYWEREFRSIRPTKSAKGQRVYSRRDVENLMRVRDLLYAEGFTIAGAKKKLQKSGVEPNAGAGAPALAAGAAGLATEATETALERSAESAPAVVARPAVLAGALLEGPQGPTRADGKRMRTTLLELRVEIEAFLRDL